MKIKHLAAALALVLLASCDYAPSQRGDSCSCCCCPAPEVPEVPVLPIVPENPIEPIDPEQPVLPIVPENPIEPIDPEQPVLPIVPELPIEPEVPVDPPVDPPIDPPVDPPVDPDTDLAYVYTSSPRLLNPERTLLQEATDVANINAHFVESDIEIIDKDGVVTVIYNCTTSPVVCAAQESKVSPDGKKIAFSVSMGDVLESANVGFRMRTVVSAQLYVYDVDNGQTTLVAGQNPNVINRMPDWINNTTLVYASNEGNTYGYKDQCSMHEGINPDTGRSRLCNPPYGASQIYGYGPDAKGMQIWRTNLDGSDKRNLTPHEANAIRPVVLKNPMHLGRILYSTHQQGEDKAFYGPSPTNNAGTGVNLWWLASMDQNGADTTVVLGGHNSPLIPNSKYLDEGTSGGQQDDKLLAIRAAGEDNAGYIYATSYYRRNHYGVGNTYKFSIFSSHAIEGCSTEKCFQNSRGQNERVGSGQYIPINLIPVSPFAVAQDIPQRFDSRGRVMGKTGFPSPLPNGNILMTYCKGWCYNQLSEADKKKVTDGGMPLRDEGLYEMLVPIVTDPFDPDQMKLLVDDPLKLERDGQAIVATSVPPQTPPLTGDKCYLNVVDVRRAEVSPKLPYTKYRELGWMTALQGNAVNADSKWTAAELEADPTRSKYNSKFHFNSMKSFSIQYADLWDIMYSNPDFVGTKNYMGIKRTYAPVYAEPKADGSLSMEVECERPFKMSGVDAQGAQVAHDPMLQSLRTGETRTCHGCHDGHSIERSLSELGGEVPTLRFARTEAARAEPVTGVQEPAVTWPQIQTILINKCSTCHEGFNNDDGLLWDRVAADFEQLDWAWIPRKANPNGDYRIWRSCFSQMVCRYARWSPLYWAAKGQRLDGFTNEKFAEDFDIPVDHPKATTDAEARKIAIWIGMGAPND